MSETPVQDLFTKFKAWYKSKTIIGIIIAAIGTVIGIFLPETDLQGAVGEVLDSEELAQGADSIYALVLQFIGLAYATYGRIVAKLGIK